LELVPAAPPAESAPSRPAADAPPSSEIYEDTAPLRPSKLPPVSTRSELEAIPATTAAPEPKRERVAKKPAKQLGNVLRHWLGTAAVFSREMRKSLPTAVSTFAKMLGIWLATAASTFTKMPRKWVATAASIFAKIPRRWLAVAGGLVVLSMGIIYLATHKPDEVHFPPPVLSSVEPALGPISGGTVITLTGTNFRSGATVSFGGVAATNVSVSNKNTITATAPKHSAAVVDIVLTNADGQSAALPAAYTYARPPSPSALSVSPASGPIGGGTSITVTGSNFAAGATVTLDGVAATDVVVLGETITAVTPAHAEGTVNLVVSNPDGQSGVLSGGFSYQSAPIPDVKRDSDQLAGEKKHHRRERRLQRTPFTLEALEGTGRPDPNTLAGSQRHGLLEEALQARKAEDPRKAIRAAVEARRIHPAPSIGLFIAEEQTGILDDRNAYANAWAGAEKCAKEAKDEGLKDIFNACDSLMTKLNQKATRLIVSMKSPLPPGGEVRVRSHNFSEYNCDRPFHLTPGDIKVDASAPDFAPFEEKVVGKPGEEVKVLVELKPLSHR
jgi:hypothetical protein